MDTPSMLPVFLRELELAGAARAADGEVAFPIDRRWCAPGEDRLGYCGVVRLMECVRELHWRHDVSPRYPHLDTISRSLDLELVRPLIAGSEVRGTYTVVDVGSRSYTLEILLRDGSAAEELARGSLVSVFYDGGRHRTVEPPVELAAALRGLASASRTGGL
jgi:acyl-CoA thioesterase FadM